jgi:hypothetical protein
MKLKILFILFVLALSLSGCATQSFKRECKVMPLGSGQLGAGDEWAIIMNYDIETGKMPMKNNSK